ncbi:hypothetical protein IP87_12410 [beta proteobacterium AAP121]|nr:hypothetical protein IP80_09675 [beta proteobacterium AAP65]KPF97176.1 hypothetical protein IP87_12410 [beta proteobacterium AAP121]
MSLDDIVRETSFDLYQTELHYEICRAVAHRRSDDPVARKVLENLYALKSNAARKATALVAYVQRSAVPVQGMCVNASVREMLPPGWGQGVRIEPFTGTAEPFIGWNHVGLLLAKALLHRLFRLLAGRAAAGDTLVRAWVEVSAAMYPAEVRQGQVLVYPFALNVMRQVRFLRWCRREGIQVSLAGMPYSLPAILAGLLRRQPNDLLLAQAEMRANARHAQELLAQRPRQLMTSDEFETASLVLYQPLLAACVKVVNTAHGVGNYCPHIAYSEFRVLAPAQSDFYVKRNPDIRYIPLATEKRQITGLSHYSTAAGKPAALVLIHQPFDLSPLKAEEAVQAQLDAELARLAQVLCLQYRVKMHPNSRQARKGATHRSFQGEPVYDWAALDAFRPIFVTINSTVFFDARGVAPVLVYAGATFEPALYFTPPIMTITLQDAEQVLRGLLPEDAWMRAAAFHAQEAEPAVHAAASTPTAP